MTGPVLPNRGCPPTSNRRYVDYLRGVSEPIDDRPERDAVLRVLTLNIGSLFEPDWDERRHEIVAWIDRLAPDVIALQEVQESESVANTAAWLAEAGAGDWHWAFGGDGLDQRLWPDPTMRFGSAVLSRWPIDEQHYHRLGFASGADLIVEGVPWELFHARTCGIDLFSTHLAPAPSHGAHRQH